MNFTSNLSHIFRHVLFVLLGLFFISMNCFSQTNLGHIYSGDQVFVLAFGDSGTGDKRQQRVAEAMTSVCSDKTCHIAIMLGDNFYEDGVTDVNDDQFDEKFVLPYASVDVDAFYPTLGNHDYDGNEQAQIDYMDMQRRWVMPARYYRYKAGPVEFFVIDSERYSSKSSSSLDDQRDWLKDALKNSNARWKVVYGHHVMQSFGTKRNDSETERLRDRLMDDGICDYADMYVSGHDHTLQYLRLDKCRNLPIVISGAAAKERSIDHKDKVRSDEYARGDKYGFARILFRENKIEVKFYNDRGEKRKQIDVPKRRACFYKKNDYDGTAHCYLGTKNLSSSLKNKFKSVRISPKYSVYACDHADLEGPCVRLKGNISNLKDSQLDEDITSLRVDKR